MMTVYAFEVAERVPKLSPRLETVAENGPSTMHTNAFLSRVHAGSCHQWWQVESWIGASAQGGQLFRTHDHIGHKNQTQSSSG